MPLQKQATSISFTGGVDTKTDPKQVLSTKLLALENGIFGSPGRLRLAVGSDQLGDEILTTTSSQVTDYAGPTTIETGEGNAVFTYGSELLKADSGALYSYTTTDKAWYPKRNFESVAITQTTIARASTEQINADAATHPVGVRVAAWEAVGSTPPEIRYSVQDVATGLAVVSDAQLIASGNSPRCVVCGGYILILYVDGATHVLSYKAIRASTPGTIGAAVSLGLVCATTAKYDATVIGVSNYLYVAANVTSSTAKDISVCWITPALVQSSVTTFTAAGVPQAVGIWADSGSASSNVVIGWGDTTNVKTIVYNAALTAVIASALTVGTSAHMVSITGAPSPDATVGGSYWVAFYDDTLAGVYKAKIAAYALTLSATLAMAGSALAARAFGDDEGVYAAVYSLSLNQPTYYLVNLNTYSTDIVAKWNAGLAPGPPLRNVLSTVTESGEDTYAFAILTRQPLQVMSGVVFSITGVDHVELSFTGPYVSAEAGGSVLVSGGQTYMYDGVNLVELGFNEYPICPSATPPSAGTTYSYEYVAVYEWTDAKGLVHRSAPSVPLVMTSATAVDATHTAQVVYSNLLATNKSGVRILLFRTPANTTGVFYQVFSGSPHHGTGLNDPILNDKTALTSTFYDFTPDATLVGNQQLYTTGGVLENIAPPASTLLVTHQNRVWLLNPANPLQLWYSKKIIQGAPVEFNDAFVLTVPPGGGDVTGIASLDDKVIVFKERSIFVATGDGPDDVGNGTFTDPQLIQADGGCIEPRSIVLVPDGIMYRSAKGIYLLTRALQLRYVGAEVEAWTKESTPITSATLLESTHQVRFTLGDGLGVALVWDYLFGQWSVRTNRDAVAACMFDGQFTWIRPDGQVLQEGTTYSDAGSVIPMRVQTSWIQLAGLQGYQRLYDIYILGDYLSAHKLQVEIAVDFNPTPVQTVLIDCGSIIGTATPYGTGTYGVGTPYGGAFALEQFKIKPIVQKCQSIQVTITSVEDTVVGEGLALSGLTLVYGVKAGGRKLPATRTF